MIFNIILSFILKWQMQLYIITCMYQPLRSVLLSKTNCLENAKKNKYAGTKEHSIDNQQLNKMLIYVKMPKMSSHQDTI